MCNITVSTDYWLLNLNTGEFHWCKWHCIVANVMETCRAFKNLKTLNYYYCQQEKQYVLFFSQTLYPIA